MRWASVLSRVAAVRSSDFVGTDKTRDKEATTQKGRIRVRDEAKRKQKQNSQRNNQGDSKTAQEVRKKSGDCVDIIYRKAHNIQCIVIHAPQRRSEAERRESVSHKWDGRDEA